jgi:hypothetical protein
MRKKDLTTSGTPSLKMMEEIFEKNKETVKQYKEKYLMRY